MSVYIFQTQIPFLIDSNPLLLLISLNLSKMCLIYQVRNRGWFWASFSFKWQALCQYTLLRFISKRFLFPCPVNNICLWATKFSVCNPDSPWLVSSVTGQKKSQYNLSLKKSHTHTHMHHLSWYVGASVVGSQSFRTCEVQATLDIDPTFEQLWTR